MSIEVNLFLFAMVAIAVPCWAPCSSSCCRVPPLNGYYAFATASRTVASVGLAAAFAGNSMNVVDVTWAVWADLSHRLHFSTRMSTLLTCPRSCLSVCKSSSIRSAMSDKNKEHLTRPPPHDLTTFSGHGRSRLPSSTIVSQLVFSSKIRPAYCSWASSATVMTP